MFIDLIENIGLLLALSILNDFIVRRWSLGSRISRTLSGLLFGGVTVVGMINPWHLMPGLIFDGRSIVIGLAGLFGGPLTAAIAGSIAAGYRLWLGGPGMVMGVCVIGSSALLGIGYRRLALSRPHLMKTRYFFLFGITVHLVMLLMTFTIPQPVGLTVLRKIWFPVMLIYPLGTLLMASLLFGQESRLKDEEELRIYKSELERLVEERTARLEATGVELERSNKELEQFAYVASHDLQEPLRMVESYLQLIARRYREKLDPDADDFIAFAVDGANRMKRLINDLLTFSRVGTRGRELGSTDMNGVMNRAVDALKRIIGETGAAITSDPLPVVMGDESQLTQLLQNLIGNGLKFRGNVTPAIHVSAEPVSGKEGGVQKAREENGSFGREEWLFSICDNGIGIDPEYREKIFQVFQRLHTMEEYPGTGIGLALCRKIVERHGGRIWVESEERKGSTFYFTLKGA